MSTTAGDHVPVMPFGDVPNNVGTVPPVQIVPIAAKSGVIDVGLTVTFNTCVVAHCPAVGVNV